MVGALIALGGCEAGDDAGGDVTVGTFDAMAHDMTGDILDGMLDTADAADAAPPNPDATPPDATPDAFACNGAAALCDRRYDEVVYATTHNAMSSAERRWGAPNQTHAVPRQLADGVRGLMLDTHLDDDGTPLLCHGFCSLGSQPLTDGLAEIGAFLDAHPGAVVTIIFESYVGPDATAAAFAAAGLAERAHHQPLDMPWPTLRALIDAGTPLVVFTDDGRAAGNHPWLHHVWSHAFETDFSNETPDDLDCDDNRGEPDRPLFILNHFLTAPIALPRLAEQVNGDAEAHARECAALHGVMPQFVTVDFYEIGAVVEAVERLNGVR